MEAINLLRRPSRRRARRRETLVAIALVAIRARAEAERLRSAHAALLALYNDRGRESERLYRRIRELESENRGIHRRAA